MSFGSFISSFADTSDRTPNPPPNAASGGTLAGVQGLVSGTLDSISRLVVNSRTRPQGNNLARPAAVPVANQARGVNVLGFSMGSLLLFVAVAFGAFWLFRR